MLVDVVFLQALKYRTVSFFVVLVGVGLVVVASGEAEVVHVQVSPLDSQCWHASEIASAETFVTFFCCELWSSDLRKMLYPSCMLVPERTFRDEGQYTRAHTSVRFTLDGWGSSGLQDHNS